MTQRTPRGGGPAGIRYARCDTLAPGIRVDDLTGGTGAPSGGNMPTVVIPPEVPPGLPFGPDAYIADPDGEGVICGDCVKPGEIEQYIPDPRSTAGTVAA